MTCHLVGAKPLSEPMLEMNEFRLGFHWTLFLKCELLIRTLGTIFSEILSEIHSFSFMENAFEKVVCEMAAICLGLNVSIQRSLLKPHEAAVSVDPLLYAINSLFTRAGFQWTRGFQFHHCIC